LGLRLSQKAAVVGGLFVLLIIILTIARSGATTDTGDTLPTVSLESISALSGGSTGAVFVGTVRSESQADIIAQSSGTVTSVSASIGQSVSAGSILAELENASQRAAVLTAQGSYDAARAAQTSVSPVDSATNALNTYNSAYDTLDTVLHADADLFFGGPTTYGPQLLISAPMYNYGELSKERSALTDEMNAYQQALPNAASADAPALLTSATSVAQDVSDFLNKLATAANDRQSEATSAQLSALSTARASVSALLATLSAARQSFRTQSVTSTASTDASVTIALGGLRLAEANLEKTRIRAPISGTVNFLPLHVGDFVSMNERVATVAQNGALEIVSYVSEDVRNRMKVGDRVTVGDSATGIITSIAPALDPVSKQIEVHVAVDRSSGLVNGQSVSLALAGAPAPIPAAPTTASSTPLLPLTSVKLSANERDIFTVGSDSRLVAIPVQVGDVTGDRIQITTMLDASLEIVTDARGLSNGEKVSVATSTSAN
jgi:RND family efflux transporter MFP subunit